jgi:hypothetical protein
MLLHLDNHTAGPMLSLAGISTASAVEQFDPATRFECWTVGDALHASRDGASLREGYRAGKGGAPCPGPARNDAFRLGWEMGAIAAGRVPPPAWMLAVNAQADRGCAGSA